jgi:hypothetical protein
MDANLPWYKSAIIRQQVTMMLVSIVGLTGVSLGVDVAQIVEVGFAIIPIVITARTIWTRLFKASPPITEKAATAERALILDQKSPPAGQGGAA